MLMAGIMWFLGLMGVAPTEEDFVRMRRDFQERGHHLVVDFGSQRTGGTRWSDPDWVKRPMVGFGYEYLVDHRFHGVGFEVDGQFLGYIRTHKGIEDRFYVGGGLNYYPIRLIRLFAHGGTEIDLDGNAVAVGRAGLGIKFMFFRLAMQPYGYVQVSSDGILRWAINFRFEY